MLAFRRDQQRIARAALGGQVDGDEGVIRPIGQHLAGGLQLTCRDVGRESGHQRLDLAALEGAAIKAFDGCQRRGRDVEHDPPPAARVEAVALQCHRQARAHPAEHRQQCIAEKFEGRGRGRMGSALDHDARWCVRQHQRHEHGLHHQRG